MSVILCSADLMAMSRIEGAATRASIPFNHTPSWQEAVQSATAAGTKLLLVDLSLASLDIDELVRRIRVASPAGPAIVAFGPHVQKERLSAARTAGCDQVLTRGQFFTEIDALIRETA